MYPHKKHTSFTVQVGRNSLLNNPYTGMNAGMCDRKYFLFRHLVTSGGGYKGCISAGDVADAAAGWNSVPGELWR